MAKRRRKSPNGPNRKRINPVTEFDRVSAAGSLPEVPTRLRTRVLTAATQAYGKARRRTQAKQAASLLSICLLLSLLLAPIAIARAVWRSYHPTQAESAIADHREQLAAGSWRTNRELLNRPAESSHELPPADQEHFDRNERKPEPVRAATPLAEGWESINSVISTRSKLPKAVGVQEGTRSPISASAW